jgi:hypothetical protein
MERNTLSQTSVVYLHVCLSATKNIPMFYTDM